MTDEELCVALTGRLQARVYQDGWSTFQDERHDSVVVAHKTAEADANSFKAQFRVWRDSDSHDICVWASDLHLHVFVNGACVFFAMANYAELELMPNARELWNAVRGIQAGGAMPDAARAREQLVAALSGGAA